MSRIRRMMLPAMLAAFAAATGCNDNTPAPADGDNAAAGTSADAAPTWLVAAAPADAKSVTETKAWAREGDEVVVRGRIGGRLKPIGADSPVFTIVDLAVPHCAQIEGDSCPTPWDYCCESPESKALNSATVQIVDESGQALNVDPVAAGLKPLDIVIVRGVVGPRPSDTVLTVKARAIHREGQEEG